MNALEGRKVRIEYRNPKRKMHGRLASVRFVTPHSDCPDVVYVKTIAERIGQSERLVPVYKKQLRVL